MRKFAEAVVQKPVAEVLREIFPKAPFDCDEVALAIVERADMAAILEVDSREEAMQEALAAAMAYMSRVTAQLRRENEELGEQVKRLNVLLAQSYRNNSVRLETP